MFKLENTNKCLNNEERVLKFKERLIQWLVSESMQELIRLFGGDISYVNLSDEGIIEYLYSFSSEYWEFRKGKERFHITERLPDALNAQILELCDRLGIYDTEVCMDDISPAPDYILILGGAKMANYNRTLMAKRVYEAFPNASIVALTGYRPLAEQELADIKEYAPNAKTEVEAINVAIECIFNVKIKEIESHIDANNHFFDSAVYCSSDSEIKISTICAPSTDESRRANSLDTFSEFINKYNINCNENVLLITSSIYKSYQLLKFAPLAINNGINVDILGVDKDIQGGVKRNAVLYLQEIKSTIAEAYHIF